MEISANIESVQALRDFAEAMPYAARQIEDATERLQNVFYSLSNDLGYRATQFEEIVAACSAAARVAADSISDLPAGLNATADDLEAWLYKQLDVEGDSGAPRRGSKVYDSKTVIKR